MLSKYIQKKSIEWSRDSVHGFTNIDDASINVDVHDILRPYFTRKDNVIYPLE